ncbi:ABC transporter substrate-binding protein [bacterium]|nr:ABC transporter substrate-binding protein [bacterium]
MKVLPFLLICVILFSCATFPLGGKGDENLSKDEEVTKIRTLVFEEDFKGARELGQRYLLRFKDSKDAGEVRIYVGNAELQLGHTDLAIKIVSPIFKKSYSDKLKVDAYIIIAKANIEKGSFLGAVENILKTTAFKTSKIQLSEAKELILETGKLLPVEDLEELVEKYNSSPLLAVLLEKCLKLSVVSEDRRYENRVRKMLSELAGYDLSEHKEDTELSKQGKSSPLRIGVICPLTGRFSQLGKSFVRGATLALKEARKGGIDNLELVIGDTKANSLDAYSITKSLIRDKKVDVIVGGISSSSTVAAAQVAQSNKIILFSPAASERGIDGIGDYIFQDLRNYEAEIIAIAKIACRDLGIRRIAFLASNNPLNKRIELLLRAEVERVGGIVCVVDYYEEGCTDFRRNIDRIKIASPEALFIPSGKDDLVLILPQLSFYEFGVQLLGLSTWDFDDLIQMIGRDMTGAVFPAETGTNRDRELYLSAASYIGEPREGTNRFEVDGYIGTKRVIDLLTVNAPDMSLRKRMEYLLNNRLNPYLEAISSDGILFYTVRNRKKELFLTHRVSNINQSSVH